MAALLTPARNSRRICIERIGPTQLGAVDQAHEDVADIRAIFRFIEERVLAMQNRFLQSSFAKIVVQWRSE